MKTLSIITIIILYLLFRLEENRMLTIPFLSSLSSVLVLMPILIKVAIKFKFYDVPNERKSHKTPIPRLGGVLIMFIVIVSSLLFGFHFLNTKTYSILLSLSLMFIMGVVDDLKELKPSHKFIVQIISSFILFKVGISTKIIFDALGFQDVPSYIISISTIVLIVGCTNAFNFIDGINGLAGSLGLIASLVLSYIQFNQENYFSAILNITISGGLLAFLKYNFNKAKIFMGDTGSQMLGFIFAFCALDAVNTPKIAPHFSNILVTVFSLLLIPVYDTIRIIIIRVKNKKSPFSADRNHVHHLLLNIGFKHRKATLVLVSIQIFLVFISYYFKHISTTELITLLVFSTIFFYELYYFLLWRKYSMEKKVSEVKIKHIIKENYLLNRII